jgi:hypothetical protein
MFHTFVVNGILPHTAFNNEGMAVADFAFLQKVLSPSQFLGNKTSLVTSTSVSVSGVAEWFLICVMSDSCIAFVSKDVLRITELIYIGSYRAQSAKTSLSSRTNSKMVWKCMARRQFLFSSSNNSRNNIDAQGYDDGIINKRKKTMQQCQSPYIRRGDLNIRNLEGHSQYKRKIGKIEIIRHCGTGELQTPVIVTMGARILIRISIE